MQEIIFDLLFPFEKYVEKSEILKFFSLGKNSKPLDFILEKLKLEVGVYFLGAI
jgi:hypothetical protein